MADGRWAMWGSSLDLKSAIADTQYPIKISDIGIFNKRCAMALINDYCVLGIGRN
jgi:hypothetical protein